MADEFAKLCQEAAVYGADIVLEIMPWSMCEPSTPAWLNHRERRRPTKWRTSDRHPGIIARGNIPYADIQKIPTRYIKAVEVDDAPKVPPIDDLWEETIHHRELPGEGELGVPAFLREIRAAGYRGVYGTEILSARHRKLGLDEMAKRVFDSTMAQFARL
jgi:sugar phosphate isomerase/epimerase